MLTEMVMQQIYELVPTSNENSGIKFGGGAFIDDNWPQNPLGENLTLLLTIDNDKLTNSINSINLPKAKYISVFSTYNENRYFLDDIVYFGDDAELDHLKSGFTRVTLTETSTLRENSNSLVPQYLELEKTQLKNNEYPAFSFLSNKIPNGIVACEKLLNEYDFIGQLYSSDIPVHDGGALFLSDAIGYLFLKKKIDDFNNAGLFFVQTA
jgi:hypothetical protein